VNVAMAQGKCCPSMPIGWVPCPKIRRDRTTAKLASSPNSQKLIKNIPIVMYLEMGPKIKNMPMFANKYCLFMISKFKVLPWKKG